MTPLGNLLVAAAVAIGLTAVGATSSFANVDQIVLVHGMNVDGSSWRPVYDRLTAQGYDTTIVQLPQTSTEEDVRATRRTLDLLQGDILLMGHSYGGMVISEAGTDPDVAGLIYVAAFQPAPGETMGELSASIPLGTAAGQCRGDRGRHRNAAT